MEQRSSLLADAGVRRRRQDRRPSARGRRRKRPQRSTQVSIISHGSDREIKRYRTSGSASGAFEHLCQRRTPRLLCQMCQQELLQRLPSRCRPAAQHGMDVVRNLLYLNRRHFSAILAPQHAKERSANHPIRRGADTVLGSPNRRNRRRPLIYIEKVIATSHRPWVPR